MAPLLTSWPLFSQNLKSHKFFIWTSFKEIITPLEIYRRSLHNELILESILDYQSLSILISTWVIPPHWKHFGLPKVLITQHLSDYFIVDAMCPNLVGCITYHMVPCVACHIRTVWSANSINMTCTIVTHVTLLMEPRGTPFWPYFSRTLKSYKFFIQTLFEVIIMPLEISHWALHNEVIFKRIW
jgi:hypothetical protein